jgi:hypothetical protein
LVLASPSRRLRPCAGYLRSSTASRIALRSRQRDTGRRRGTMSARTGVRRGIALSIVAVATTAIWLAGVVAASADDPAGNNGTVMVAGASLGDGTEPHVGCAFAVEFFGYDEGDLYADFTIVGLAPTEEGTFVSTFVFVGEDPAGGATDLDASASVDLSGSFSGSPQTEQGFHVRLTVHADGSRGADVKHKTFWVDCADEEEESSET